MANKSQQIFKRIVLHNKLLPEARVDALLSDTPDPELAVQLLVSSGTLPAKTAAKLMELYKKQIDKLMDEMLGGPTTGDSSGIHASPQAAFDVNEPPPGSAIISSPGLSTASKAAPGAASPEKKPRAEPADPGKSGPLPASKPAIQGHPVGAAVRAAPPRNASEAAGKGLIHRLLKAARDAGASDLHFKAGAAPIVRLAGLLRDVDEPPLPPEVCEHSLLEILEPHQRKDFEEHQDLDFCYDGGPELGRFRTNYLRQHRGMDAVFRLIPSQAPRFADLSLPEQVQKFTDYRVGIVLVTGPKGCGKTTTLAAMVDLINSTRAEHIITLEDPIEFVHPSKKGHVNQREVGRHTETFSNALRAALREAPDVIMVGEMRDLETTSLAITAAETGHLVLATLHTPNAVRTIGRVLDVFPPKEQGQIRAMLSESLRGVVSQLLIPSPDGSKMQLAVEILVNNSAIGNLIREDRTFQLPGIMQTSKRQGMQLMDDSLIRLAKDAKISKEDALARAEDLAYVEKELTRT